MNKLENAQIEYKNFPQKFASIILSTLSQQRMPNASYAPFVMDDAQNIYIYVSGLATHTQNIQAYPQVNILFIEDESETSQIFARTRLSFDCTATLIERETEKWHHIVNQFQDRFGQIIEMLRDLPDFRIFQLTPSAGRFVLGFGSVYSISGDNLNQLIPMTGS